MGFMSVRAHSLLQVPNPHGWLYRWSFAFLLVMLTMACFAQVNQPSQPPKPLIIPEANPLPDKNQQMEMRERNVQRRNFNAANAERLRQMTKASEMLETLAMALKAEVDNTPPGPASANAMRKADNIEKLARIVKDQMTLTMAPQ